MRNILFVYSKKLPVHKLEFLQNLESNLIKENYDCLLTTDLNTAAEIVKSNNRVASIILDWDHFELSAFEKLADYNPNLPIFAIGDNHLDIELNLVDFELNLDFLQYDAVLLNDDIEKIINGIDAYYKAIMPPFTKQLMHYINESNYSFCTPGHQQGHGFQKSPVGAAFYDFFGPNVFKSDISISMEEMGSLLDHSGPHKEAEDYVADIFNADRSLIVTNGTSTSNKIVGMYSAGQGDTILVDRNCHKSLTHLMMMVDVNPIYLKPTRNAYGIIGGIPLSEFTSASIEKKLSDHPVAESWPRYCVITNSTYDGIFYNVNKVHQELDVVNLHFDSAWVPYTNFHSIYEGKYGMSIKPKLNHTIFETQSTHKLLAAFSQASMVHVKGHYDNEKLNETFMMHTSTSPFYPIVASCEVSAAMMKGKLGQSLINDCINYALDFRKEIVKLKEESLDWYYDIWQPENIDEQQAWPIDTSSSWHGFNEVEDDYLYLDPVKVTVILPGIDKEHNLEKKGIPASIVAQFLEDHGIIVEKTGPYTMLFLFSIGITRAKSMKLLATLNKFKQMYDQNRLVKDVLPTIYSKHPDFYENIKIQDLCEKQHGLVVKHNLPQVMFHAFDKLPEYTMSPYQAYQKLNKGDVVKVCLDDLLGHTSAVMVLPYPPGIPLIMPGERITLESKVTLDYLLMLKDIGAELPGFEYDIHGLEKGDDGKLYIKVII
ncbi:lysine decarboxylase LdcC [Candidatus Francisella endociliophora]|uniref:Lysine decarboxylase LdcC n=1 Tax=Candidatus Francisella endociliophora TaxID=653937 RepID=A0A097EQU8_9GAMM|nr:lysine decarboxylase LdcC [Francisella sp. FSC1006]AIT09940.1 lysine decarboxylase LdcC [Francisella sp. FSC1006]